MAQKVGKAPQIKAEIVIPEDWTVVGYQHGTPIVEREVEVRDKQPILDKEGNQVFRKDRKGNELGARHRITRSTVKKRFWMVRSPRGHIRLQEHFEPSKEELAAAQRREQVAAFQARLAEAAVERGLTPEQVVEGLLSGGTVTPAEKQPVPKKAEKAEGDDPAEPTDGWPQAINRSWYLLSNGDKVQGEEKAREAQKALDDEAKAPADEAGGTSTSDPPGDG